MPAPLTPAPFDHWPRYQELTELLESWVAERPQLLTVVSIGRSHEGRDIWICEVTDEATGPARDKPAVWVDANIHATEVTGGAAALHLVHTLLAGHDDGRADRPRASRPQLLRGAAAEPRRRRAGAGRRAPLRAVRRAPLAASVRASRPALVRRGRGRPHPVDADPGRDRQLEDAPRASAPAGAARCRRGGRRAVLPAAARGAPDRLRRRHHQAAAQPGRARLQPQLPLRLAPPLRSGGCRRLPDVRARDPGRGAGHRRPPEHHLRRQLPHLRRGAAAALRRPAGRRLPARRPARLRPHGRRGGAPHRVPAGVRLPPLPVRAEDVDAGRLRRLDLRVPGRVRVDDRVLEPDAGGRRRCRDALHRLVEGPPDRGRPEDACLVRQRDGRTRLHRLVSVRASAAGAGRARRLGRGQRAQQRTVRPARSGGRAAQRLGRLPGAGVAAAGGAVVHGGAGGRRRPPPAAGGAEHRLAAHERVAEGDRAEGGAPGRGGSGAGRRRTAGVRPGAHGAGAADRARRAPSACWAGTRATSRPASGRVSSGWSRPLPARWCGRRRGIRAPASAAPS